MKHAVIGNIGRDAQNLCFLFYDKRKKIAEVFKIHPDKFKKLADKFFLSPNIRISRPQGIALRAIFFIVCLGLSVLPSDAQRHEILNDNIHTLQVLPNGQWNRSPVIALGTDDYLDISFDDLTHVYHRYRYRLEHCNFDWTKTEGLFEADYVNGEGADLPIDQYQESLNTTVLYTHYEFQFPNSRANVTKSGNYRITVYDDDEEEDVCTVCFMVVDERVDILASATTNTDIDVNRAHQQIKFRVRPGALRITDATREIKTAVLQNNRWDNAAVNPKADFVTPSDIRWEYAKELIFTGGNEYRKFELTNLHVGNMGIDNLRWFRPYYHATIYTGADRRNYVYDEEQDGAFYIRTDEYPNSATQSDYLLFHFSLKHQAEAGGDIYINGQLTYDRFLPQYKMHYNQESGLYEASLLLKQGYYNYQYLYLPDKGHGIGLTANVEGDYFETENKYTILVYNRPQSGRYDQLVGVKEFIFKPNR